MDEALDLDAWFARIGWSGPREPTPAVLAGLLRAHVLAVPFENLDVLLGRPIRLDLASVQDKLVARRRGGYCFEHGTLFAAALEALGFTVRRLAARVRLGATSPVTPRTHMTLEVRLEGGAHLVDPGFGGPAPRTPMPLVEDTPHEDGLGRHRLVRQGDGWLLQGELDGAWRDVYLVGPDAQHPIDHEVANHFTSTHPRSHFTTSLVVARALPDGRVSLTNRTLVTRGPSGEARREIATRDELVAALRDLFGLDVPEAAALRVPAVPEWA